MKYTEKQINSLLEGIYAGDIDVGNLPKDLFNAVNSYLTSALGKIEGSISEAMTRELTSNLQIFSGAKVYQSVREMSLLKDDETIKTFSEFKVEAERTFDQYYKQWAQAEYNTTIGQAQMIERWEQIENQKERLPFLKYSAVIDTQTSEICLPLDGICLPVDDSFWESNSPLNHFNCRCTLEQVDEFDAVVTEQSKADEVSKEMDDKREDLFNSNPYKDKAIFNDTHPYFDIPKEDLGAVLQLADVFTPANSIKEAEAFAIKNELTASGKVDFEGMTLDTANITNKTLLETKINDNLRFNSIKVNLKETSFAGLENNGLTLMKQSTLSDNEIAKIVSNDIGKVKFLNKKEYYSSSFEVVANKIQQGSANYSKNVAELTKELSIKHEISHLKQSFIKDASKGAFGDELKLSSKKWYSKWEKTIESIKDNKGWHPSEYVKKWVYLEVREKEFFAESKTLFDYDVNLIKDEKIKDLLKEFDVIFNDLKTKIKYNG